MQRPLYLASRPCALMERGENRNQHIGVMLDLVKVKAILVIAGVVAFVIVQLVLQRGFQITVGGFGCKDVRVLRLVGGSSNAAARAGKQDGTGLQPADQQHDKQETGKHDQTAFPMPRYKRRCFLGFLGNALRRLCAGFCGFLGGLRRGLCCAACAFRRPRRFRILLFQLLLLEKAGHGVASGKLGVIVQRLVVQIIRVRLCRRPFCLFHGTVGLHFVVTVRAAHTAPDPALRKFLCLVSAFHAHIFIFNLMDLAVRHSCHFVYRSIQRIVFELGRLLIHLVKAQTGMPLAGCFVKDALFGDNGLFRHGCPRRIQLVGFLVRVADILLQLRGAAFLVGELQSG